MKIWALTFNTFRETIRNRVLYNILAFAVFMITLATALGRISFNERVRVTIDFGLSSISIFGIFIAIFLGIGLISKEIEKKTVHTLISKPLPRYQFILGRYLGLMLTLFVNMTVMAAAFTFILMYSRQEWSWPLTWPIVQAMVLIFLELSIITAVAIMFSTMSSAMLSALFTLSIFLIGRFTAGIKEFADQAAEPFFHWGGAALYYAAPNLTNFIPIQAAVHGEGLGVYFFWTALQGALWTSFFLLISMLILQRKDFV